MNPKSGPDWDDVKKWTTAKFVGVAELDSPLALQPIKVNSDNFNPDDNRLFATDGRKNFILDVTEVEPAKFTYEQGAKVISCFGETRGAVFTILSVSHREKPFLCQRFDSELETRQSFSSHEILPFDVGFYQIQEQSAVLSTEFEMRLGQVVLGANLTVNLAVAYLRFLSYGVINNFQSPGVGVPSGRRPDFESLDAQISNLFDEYYRKGISTLEILGCIESLINSIYTSFDNNA